MADVINRYPDRFLLVRTKLPPPTRRNNLRLYQQFGPLWKLLTKDASETVRKGNYERFDEARGKSTLLGIRARKVNPAKHFSEIGTLPDRNASLSCSRYLTR